MHTRAYKTVSASGLSRLLAGLFGSLSLLAMVCAATGAERYTERFNSSLSGWTNQGHIVWGQTNGYAVTQFNAQGVPFSESSSFIGNTNASLGRFTGNYSGSDVELVGFKFLAENVLPTVLTFEIKRGANVFFQSLQNYVISTGVWYSFNFSLESLNNGGWIGGNETDFTNTLSDVQQLAVRVQRTGTPRQVYRVDDVYLDRIPAGSAMPTEGLTRWSNLRTNQLYNVEITDELLKNRWTNIHSFVATSNLEEYMDPSATNATTRFYRLVIP